MGDGDLGHRHAGLDKVLEVGGREGGREEVEKD